MNIELLQSNCWFNYQDFYRKIAAIPNYFIFVEVGVWKGHSISFLADLLRSRPSVQIFAVDLFEDKIWPEHQQEIALLPQIFNANLERTKTRHLIVDIKSLSHKAAERFADGSVDFVFIDADHEYPSVQADIRAWLPKVRPNGILAGHDYHAGSGVVRAVDEAFGTNKELFGENVWLHYVK